TPVPLTAGTYAFGCYEGANTTIGLAQATNLFTPGVNFYYTSGTGWAASGIQTARFIHPVFGNVPLPVGINEITSSLVNVYPNPSNNFITISLSEQKQKMNYRIVDVTGKEVLN